MNDEAGSAPGPGGNGQPDLSTPYAASGGLLRAAGQQQTLDQTDQLATFVRQQPLTAALAALAVGYVLGKIS
nr:hypothetical protein [uncultured Rhodopila sp.]